MLSQNILFSVDSSLLDTISEFVAASGRRRAPSGQHGGDDDLDLLLEQLAKPAKLEIPTALLFVGGALWRSRQCVVHVLADICPSQ